jgi:hypothetical protein
MKLQLLLFVPILLGAADAPESQLRKLLAEAKTGTVALPAGNIEITRELILPAGAHDLELRGAGTTLKASDNFRGRALLVLAGGKNIKIHDLALDGNREAVGRMLSLPPAGTMYSRAVANNGILAENVTGLEVFDIKATSIASFAVLVNASPNARLHEIEITESGGFNGQRRNNATGGILLEESSTDFEVRRCLFGGIRGAGLTIRSSDRGRITQNEFSVLAGSAIRVSGSKSIVIGDNRARQIGFPPEEVEGQPVCVSLDNVTDSGVTDNTCTDTVLGAITIGGSRNKVTGNRLLRVNLAGKDISGIFVGAGASGNTIESNEVTGSGMSLRCVGGVSGAAIAAANRIAKNDCSDEASVASLLHAIRR